MMDDHGPLLRLADVTSVTLILGTIAGYLPAIAALLSIIYYAILLTRMFNNWMRERDAVKELAVKLVEERADLRAVAVALAAKEIVVAVSPQIPQAAETTPPSPQHPQEQLSPTTDRRE